MPLPRIALVYDHRQPGDLGHDCLRGLMHSAAVTTHLPAEADKLTRGAHDLVLRIDDGLELTLPDLAGVTAWWLDGSPSETSLWPSADEHAIWFTTQPESAGLLRSAGQAAHWLPYGFDDATFQRWGLPVSWDVCLLGNFDGPLASLPDQLRKRGLSLYQGMPRREELATVVSASHCIIVPNPGDLRPEVFQVLGCEAFLFAPASPGLEALFRDGTHLASYRGLDELLDKLDYYLKKPDVRARVARAGSEEAYAKHTYRDRTRELLRTVGITPEKLTISKRFAEPVLDVVGTPTADSATRSTPQQEHVAETAKPLAVRETFRPRLSLCMIVRNSAATLEACLQSARPWFDEIVAVDTGSEDGTPVIVERYGGRLFRAWWCDSFSAARNESLRHARGEWLFWMDSDDTIDPANGRKLRALVDQPVRDDALGFVVQVHCPGRSGNGMLDATVVDHVKLVRNHPHIRFDGRIHEQVLPAIRRLGGNVIWTDVFVVHSGADLSAAAQARKLERDLRLLMLEYAEQPNHPFTNFNLGMTLSEAGRYDEAIQALARCLEVSAPVESHVAKAYSLLVHACRLAAKEELAWEVCSTGLGFFPFDSELLFRAGLLSKAAGRLHQAAEFFRRVLEGPREQRFSSLDRGIVGYKARHNLAIVLTDLGDLAAAELLWREIIASEPDYVEGRHGLEDNLVRQARTAQARPASHSR